MKRNTAGMDHVDDDDDRISQLPEDIAHHILSFLKNSPKELVRMSVLSKNWSAITAAFPNLDFNMDNFTRDINASQVPYDTSHVKNMFYKYVVYTTSRFCNQLNIFTSVRTFKLAGLLLESPSQLSIVGRCIRSILRKGGLQVLKINMDTVSPLPKYRFPHILFSVSSLSSLIIQHCELPSSLMVNDAIRFKSLKLLILQRVNINEQMIKHLTTYCPLLKIFKLWDCHGFKKFCINGFQDLEEVFLFNSELERIDIDAPNLWCLVLADDQRGTPCMNLSSCKKLTTLYYFGKPLPKLEGSTDFLSNFPCIENLNLGIFQVPGNLKLSSYSLRTLVLHPSCDLYAINIEAPNLVLLKYSIEEKFSVYEPPVRKSAKSEAQMEWFPNHDVNARCFQDLTLFLYHSNGFFKVLKLKICSTFIDLENLKIVDSRYIEHEHVEVELGTIKKLSVYAAAVDAVLWCLRPRSLTLISDFDFLSFKQRRQIVKFTHAKLLQQEDEGRINIHMVLSVSSSKDKKHINDLNSLLAALPRDPQRHTITFTKVEDPNANAVKEA